MILMGFCWVSCFRVMEWRPHFLCHSGDPGCIGDAFKGRRDADSMFYLMLGTIVLEDLFDCGKVHHEVPVSAKVGFRNSNIVRAQWIEGFIPKKTSNVISVTPKKTSTLTGEEARDRVWEWAWRARRSRRSHWYFRTLSDENFAVTITVLCLARLRSFRHQCVGICTKTKMWSWFSLCMYIYEHYIHTYKVLSMLANVVVFVFCALFCTKVQWNL